MMEVGVESQHGNYYTLTWADMRYFVIGSGQCVSGCVCR